MQTSKAPPKPLHLVRPHSGSLAPLFPHCRSRGEAEPRGSCLRSPLPRFTAGQTDAACQRSVSCLSFYTATLPLRRKTGFVSAFAGPCLGGTAAAKSLQPHLACHRLCPDLLLGLPKLGCKADSSFLITNHFPSIRCPETRSRYHPAFGGTASRADVGMRSCDGQKPPASSSDTTRRGLLLRLGWRARLESLTHQQALGFAGNLSLPCHKAPRNLFCLRSQGLDFRNLNCKWKFPAAR